MTTQIKFGMCFQYWWHWLDPNPIHSINGHYKGKVNFTMSGLWQIQLKLAKNGVLLSDQIYFETTL
jgi:hypothetical protein